jgi:hypothetical protein
MEWTKRRSFQDDAAVASRVADSIGLRRTRGNQFPDARAAHRTLITLRGEAIPSRTREEMESEQRSVALDVSDPHVALEIGWFDQAIAKIIKTKPLKRSRSMAAPRSPASAAAHRATQSFVTRNSLERS